MPEDRWPEFKARAIACYQAPLRAIARDLATGIVTYFETELATAVLCFTDDFGACIAHLRMPVNHWAIRTTNLLRASVRRGAPAPEDLFNAFGEKPAFKLMFGAMIRAAERWRAVKVTQFERRQMAALRQDLDQEYRLGSASRQSPQATTPKPNFQHLANLTNSRPQT